VKQHEEKSVTADYSTHFFFFRRSNSDGVPMAQSPAVRLSVVVVGVKSRSTTGPSKHDITNPDIHHPRSVCNRTKQSQMSYVTDSLSFWMFQIRNISRDRIEQQLQYLSSKKEDNTTYYHFYQITQ